MVSRADHDVIELGDTDGSFSSQVFVVQNNDIEISDILVTYDNGDRERIPGRLVFSHGARSHSIRLHGKGSHRVVNVSFTHRSAGRWVGDQARVSVYGVK